MRMMLIIPMLTLGLIVMVGATPIAMAQEYS
jgi:hypothetical protein